MPVLGLVLHLLPGNIAFQNHNVRLSLAGQCSDECGFENPIASEHVWVEHACGGVNYQEANAHHSVLIQGLKLAQWRRALTEEIHASLSPRMDGQEAGNLKRNLLGEKALEGSSSYACVHSVWDLSGGRAVIR